MKKLIFFLILAGVAFKLKAQEKSAPKPFESDTSKNGFSFKPIFPKSFPKNFSPEVLTQPKQNLIASNNNSVSYSEVDGMPIVKPNGNWNMPVAKPSGNYKMPIIGLPPIIKKDSTLQNFKP